VSKRRRRKRNAMRFIVVNGPAFLVGAGTPMSGEVGSVDGGFRVELARARSLEALLVGGGFPCPLLTEVKSWGTRLRVEEIFNDFARGKRVSSISELF
jgi:hypothetical protein